MGTEIRVVGMEQLNIKVKVICGGAVVSCGMGCSERGMLR